ncbi:GNAT family N-acetyltransferase [Metabacillus herbersteinensis]|uniref:GNAT family N-acetyltransferase n=1 Tax=Metabacillus herbersteinensis TaxID=283816 RepID=A0ABV6GJP3_9BACI
MEKMTTRTATIEDLPRIVEIYNLSIPGRLATADTETVSVDSREEWFYQHSENHRPLRVAERNGTIYGWLSFQSFYGRPAYVGTAELSIYIDPTMQGKGLGRLFLKLAIEDCSRLKIKTLLGFIFGHNKTSLKLFNQFDFETWGLLPNVAELDGIERDLIIVGRKVSEIKEALV